MLCVQHLDAQDRSPEHHPPFGTRDGSNGNGTSAELENWLAKFKWQVATPALSVAPSTPAEATGVARTVSTGAAAELV